VFAISSRDWDRRSWQQVISSCSFQLGCLACIWSSICGVYQSWCQAPQYVSRADWSVPQLCVSGITGDVLKRYRNGLIDLLGVICAKRPEWTACSKGFERCGEIFSVTLHTYHSALSERDCLPDCDREGKARHVTGFTKSLGTVQAIAASDPCKTLRGRFRTLYRLFSISRESAVCAARLVLYSTVPCTCTTPRRSDLY